MVGEGGVLESDLDSSLLSGFGEVVEPLAQLLVGDRVTVVVRADLDVVHRQGLAGVEQVLAYRVRLAPAFPGTPPVGDPLQLDGTDPVVVQKLGEGGQTDRLSGYDKVGVVQAETGVTGVTDRLDSFADVDGAGGRASGRHHISRRRPAGRQELRAVTAHAVSRNLMTERM